MYDLAVRTLAMNIRPWKDGLLTDAAPAIMAGESYQSPWTRDCAFNVWNAGALLAPEASRNTLLSTLTEDADGVRAGGQYWDAIAWVTGAWAYRAVTGDAEFLPLAYQAAVNSLAFFERTEFDAAAGLFEGPASYGDGVAAYPEPYCDAGGSSGILDWPVAHPDAGKNRMKALSTNCLYYSAYRIAAAAAERLGRDAATIRAFAAKADALRDAIRRHLWRPSLGRFAYYIDERGPCDEYMEGLGHAFVILLGVADEAQARAVLAGQHVCPFGIPCVWPVFPWYASDDGMSFGRHNGTIWPFIQGFWATAAARQRDTATFDRELVALATIADRAGEFKEIYHPITGDEYGGLQVDHGVVRLWRSEPNQTWSATGYLRMIHMGLFGMQFDPDGITFAPCVPSRFDRAALGPLSYRGMTLDLTLRGHGTTIRSLTLDGTPLASPRIPATLTGRHEVTIELAAHGCSGDPSYNRGEHD